MSIRVRVCVCAEGAREKERGEGVESIGLQNLLHKLKEIVDNVQARSITRCHYRVIMKLKFLSNILLINVNDVHFLSLVR